MSNSLRGRFYWGSAYRDFRGAKGGPDDCELLVDGVVTSEPVDFVDTEAGMYRVLDKESDGSFRLTRDLSEISRTVKAGKLELRKRCEK